MWSNGSGSHPCYATKLCKMRPLYAQTDHCTFYMRVSFREGGGPEERVGGREKSRCSPCDGLEPKWRQAQDFKRASRSSRKSLKFGIQIFITRSGIIPPPNPGAEIGRGEGPQLLWPQFLVLFVFYNNCWAPPPFSTRVSTHPPS